MYILGIETSCDETAAAVMDFSSAPPHLLAEEVSSQIAIHQAYGGVVPELAAREHLTNLPLVAGVVMQKAGLQYKDLAALGVTRGPGLKGCLLMGVSFAKGLSLAHGLSLVGVNHIEAHIHSAWLDQPQLDYPFLSLVVSGGHTEIVEVKALGRYEVLSRTIDDAAGEAFDKSANLLGFEYPGGAALSHLADSYGPSNIVFPIAMRDSLDFSFSGLKTAIAMKVREQGAQLRKAELASAIQAAIVETLCFKLRQALKRSKIRTLVVAGGVSANRLLRERISGMDDLQVYFPSLKHCMDNAAMVSVLAGRRFFAGQRDGLDMPVRARWPVEESLPPGSEK
jgi:N6-L-threonylcarbamoyladenine synthase